MGKIAARLEDLLHEPVSFIFMSSFRKFANLHDLHYLKSRLEFVACLFW